MSKSPLDYIQQKIITREKLPTIIQRERFLNKKIVFTNGCFDLLHPGHTHYLAEAKALGSILIVGVNADASVKQLGKGSARPLQNEQARSFNLASLYAVDYVVIFDESTPKELIQLIVPDVLVKGGDYVIENIVGFDTVIKNGGKVLTLPFLDGYSTTAIEQKIKNS
jgi:D-glycero-beta-D-manno-heptose 1-phosphate adenylyltransferase